MDVEALIRQGADTYARVRREALAAAPLITGEVERDTWNRVNSAIAEANHELAPCDEAWLELQAAYMEMLGYNGKPFRQRRMLATEAPLAIRSAARRYGPDHPLVERMRAAREEASVLSGRKLDKAKRAIDRVADAREKFGLTAAKTLSAEFRRVDVYRDLFMPAAAADSLWYLVLDLDDDDPRRSYVAGEAAVICDELAEVVTAWKCFEVHYELENASLDARLPTQNEGDDISVRLLKLSLEQTRGRLLLGAGQPAEAESVLRAVPEAARPLQERIRHRKDAMFIGEIEESALKNRGDALVALGRWREAYACFVKAHRMVSAGRTEQERNAVVRYFNSAVYADRRWQQQ